jgi:hypothetical protein
VCTLSGSLGDDWGSRSVMRQPLRRGPARGPVGRIIPGRHEPSERRAVLSVQLARTVHGSVLMVRTGSGGCRRWRQSAIGRRLAAPRRPKGRGEATSPGLQHRRSSGARASSARTQQTAASTSTARGATAISAGSPSRASYGEAVGADVGARASARSRATPAPIRPESPFAPSRDRELV